MLVKARRVREDNMVLTSLVRREGVMNRVEMSWFL